MNVTLNTHLTILRNKVFKLLPIREDMDSGADAHLGEYIESLIVSYDGTCERFPALLAIREVVDVRSNIEYLRSHQTVSLSKWRTVVLNSTSLLEKAKDGDCDG